MGHSTKFPFADCLACLVADTLSQDRALRAVVTSAGFSEIVSFSSGTAASHSALPFFFFHGETGLERASQTISRLRSAKGLRFSPAIMLLGDAASQSEVTRYVAMGFDDIIMLRQAEDLLAARLTAQLSASLSYFETETYFGPERRRGAQAVTQSGHSSRSFTRYLIRRSPTGVSILLREVFTPSIAPTFKELGQLQLPPA